MSGRRAIASVLVKAAVSLLAAVLALLIAGRIATRESPERGLMRFDDARGYQIFTSRCEVCHAHEEGGLGKMCPNLAHIGAEAATRQPGLNGPEYILQSIMEPAAFTAPGASGVTMPEKLVGDLSDDDIRNLVAHVARFGATPNADEIAALVIRRPGSAPSQVLEVRRDVIEHGEKLFREKCVSCHSLHNGPEYVVLAPAVFGVGFPDEQVLRDSIKHVHRPLKQRYRSTRIVLTSGTVLIGHIVEESQDALVILSTRSEDRGQIITVQRSHIRKGADGKPMLTDIGLPPGVREVVASLTPDDIDALVALLQTLN